MNKPLEGEYPIPVGILGATGIVGQQFIHLLQNHIWFKIVAIASSTRGNGKRYGESCQWKLSKPMSDDTILNMRLSPCEAQPFVEKECKIVFSALPTDVAIQVEDEFAKAGIFVCSNASAYRMDKQVPILLPIVNPIHLDLIKSQYRFRYKSPNKGAIITNANCSTTAVAILLAAMQRALEYQTVHICTLQAVSGAGYPGISSMDIMNNVIPYIQDEEEKIQRETLKILGTIKEDLEQQKPYYLVDAKFNLYAACHRVNVLDGHTITITIDIPQHMKSMPEEELYNIIQDALESFSPHPDVLSLPTCPPKPLKVFSNRDRPQPRLDISIANGMVLCVGPILIKKDSNGENAVIQVTTLISNTVLGAAGCAILNAELAVSKGYI